MEATVKAAEQLFAWRDALQQNLGTISSNSGGAPETTGCDTELANLDGTKPYTPASSYGAYILLAYQLISVPAKFRAAQEIMYRAMVKDGSLLPLDEQKMEGTGSPRYFANSRSYRSTLSRRDLLAITSKGRFALTDAGRQFVQDWLTDHQRKLSDYKAAAEGIISG